MIKIMFLSLLLTTGLMGSDLTKTDLAAIRNALIDLYKQPIKKFTYFDGRNRDIYFWKHYYGEYYAPAVVRKVIQKIMDSPDDLYCFTQIDPRFYPVAGEYANISNIVIGKPIVDNGAVTVMLSYISSDDINVHTCFTKFIMANTAVGWRIQDQWLGQIGTPTKSTDMSPNLIRSFD